MRCSAWMKCGGKSICRVCSLGRQPSYPGCFTGQSGLRLQQAVRVVPETAPLPRRGTWSGSASVELDIGRPVHLSDILALAITPDVSSREEAKRLVEEWTQDLCRAEEPGVLLGLRRKRGCGCGR
jgi:hypothetical protein